MEENVNQVPALICNECESNLSNIFTIRENCIKADIYIRSLCFEKNTLLKTMEIFVIDDDDDDDDNNFQCQEQLTRKSVNQNDEIAEESFNEGFLDIPLPLVGSNSLNKVQETSQINKRSRKFNCNICKKSFNSYYALGQHRIVHHKGMTLSCIWCLKPFLSATKLIRHSRTHTGDRPYTCTECPKTFKDNSNRLRHVRLFHNYNVI